MTAVAAKVAKVARVKRMFLFLKKRNLSLQARKSMLLCKLKHALLRYSGL
jgi:hypothetical protein